MHGAHSSHRSTNDYHVLQQSEVTDEGKIPINRGSDRQMLVHNA